MTDREKSEIAVSKKKMIKGLIASIFFVLLGLWIVIFQPATDNAVFNNPILKYGASLASVLFFGFAIFYYSKKLASNKPGLIIDDDGIIDNSSAVSAGRIPWTDIINITTAKVFRQEFLVLIVANPNEYIGRQTKILKRKGMQYNFRKYGSPLVISANGLTCNTKELKILLTEKLTRLKNKKQAIPGDR